MDLDTSDISGSNESSETYNNENDADKLRSCTGLLKSYHGIAYQVQWLMLVALKAKNRGVVSGFTFKTEVEYKDSGKFDDVVWQYTKENILKYNFLQAKHKLNLDEKITLKDLLKKGMDTKNNPFGLQKYYLSYIDGIKNNNKYKNGIIENLIIATNIDLEEQLKNSFTSLEIMHSLLGINDDDEDDRSPACWKIDSNKNVEIIEVLEETYDLINLAKKLEEYVFSQQNFSLPEGLLKYRDAVYKHVFNGEGNKISNDFIENKNLSREAMFLREALFQEAFINKRKRLLERYEIHNPDKFAEHIAEIINNTSNKVVKLIKYKAVEQNINKLANFVLIKEDGIKFNSRFWTNHDDEMPNNTFKTFRNKLKTKLIAFGILENNDTNAEIVAKLNEYRFKIANFTTCKIHLIDESSFWNTVKKYNNFSENINFETNNLPRELPSYSLNDIKSDIKIFLDNLVFAVNYTKTKLNSVMKNYLEQNFKWIDNEYTAYAFRSEIAHALDVTEENFISTAEEVSQFFDKLKQKSNQLILIGPTLEYSTKISFYNIRFKPELINELPLNSFINNKLEDFITMPITESNKISSDSDDISSKQVYCIISEQNILSSIKVLHILQNISTYSNQKNYIFMRLDSILYLQDYVIQVFQDSVNLLIIECVVDKVDLKEEILVRKVYRKILNVLRSNRNKKVLLISQGNDLLSSTLRNELKHTYFEKIDSEICLASLEEATQLNILQRGKIIFQGEEISINKLVTELKVLIDSQMLYKLINDEKLEICNSLSDLKEIKNYYIPRELICRKKVSSKIIKEDSVTDLFAFSNTEANELRDLARQNKVTPNIRTCKFIDNFNDNNCSIVTFIILDNQLDTSQYSRLCNIFQNRNVHWLIKEGNYFKWKQTEGVLTTVRPYLRDRKYYKEINKNKDNVNEIITELKNERVIIIAAEPGMGKSTMITHLAVTMKKINPTIWVTVIDLRKHRSLLKKIQLSDANSAMEFLFKVIGLKVLQEMQQDTIAKEITRWIQKNSNIHDFKKEINIKGINLLEIAILRNMLFRNNEVFIFFDGYDEISPEFGNHVRFLINVIKNTTLANIWITSRTYNIIHKLEDNLGTFSYSIKPFGGKEQREFLMQFWRSRLNVGEFDEQRSEIFIQELLSEFSEITNDTKRTFVGIPLQIGMLAQNRFEMFKEFYESGVLQLNNEYRLRIKKGLNLVNLYEEFINIKFHEIRFKEKKPDVWPSDDEDIEKMIEEERIIFTYEHQILAVYTLYKDKGFEKLFPEKIKETSLSLLAKIANGADKNAIIDRVIDDTPLFVHQTYVEFFAALFLWNKYKTLTLQDFCKCFLPNILNGIFFSSDKIQVCKFFYYIAEKCLRSDKENDSVQMREKIIFTLKELVPEVKNVYALYENAGTDLENGIDSLKDWSNHQNVAKETNNVQVVKLIFLIIESYLCRDKSENPDIDTVINDDKSISLLRMASEIGCINFVKMCIEKTRHNYQQHVESSKWYFSPLWLAAKNGHLESLGCLSGIIDRKWCDKDGLTLTQRAYNLPEINVLRNCLKLNILDASPYFGLNKVEVLPIVRAVENVWPSDIIELLIEKTDVNTFNHFTCNKHGLKGSFIVCIYLLKHEKYITDLILEKGFNFSGAINTLLFEFRYSSLVSPIKTLTCNTSWLYYFPSENECLNLFDLILKVLNTGVGYNTTDKHKKTTSQYAKEIYYMHKLFQNMSNNIKNNRVLDTLLWLIIDATMNHNRDFQIVKYKHNLQLLTNRYPDMHLISVFDEDIFSYIIKPTEDIRTNIDNLKSYIEKGNEELVQFKNYDDSKLYTNIFTGYEEMLQKFPNNMSKVKLFQSLSNFVKIMLKRILILYIRQDYEIREAFVEVTRNIQKYKEIHTKMQNKSESCNMSREEFIAFFGLHDIEISQSEPKMQWVKLTENISQCGSLDSLHQVWSDLNYVGEKRLLDAMKMMPHHVQMSSQIFELFRTLDECYNNLMDAIKNNSQGIYDILNSIDNCLIKAVINGRDENNSSPLHYAAKDKQVVDLLLKYGANCDDNIDEDNDFMDNNSNDDNDAENYYYKDVL